MKNTFKKMKSVLALALVMTVGVSAFPKKSEAGFIFGAAGASIPYDNAGYTAMAIVCFVFGVVYDNLGLIVLDGSSSMKDQLSVGLAKSLNTIDDTDVIAEVAGLVTSKYEAQKSASEQVLIKLSDEEINSIASRSARPLTVEQLTQLRQVAQ